MKRIVATHHTVLSIFYTLILMIFVLSGCSKVSDAISDNPTGDKYIHTVTVDGMVREFIVYVSQKARRDGHAPVVLMFHGTSGDGEKFYNISGWTQKSDTEGLIAVFPSALYSCFKEDENGDGDFSDGEELKTTTKWMGWDWATTTKFAQCTPADIAALSAADQVRVNHPYPNDVIFFDAMLDYLGAHYSIDQKRIYATGFSNGGQFTSQLAMERSEKLAATAGAAGGLSLPAVAATRPLTHVFTFGSLDDRFTTLIGVNEIPMQEMTIAIPLIDAMVDTLRTVVQVTDAYTYTEQTISSVKTSRWTYAASTAGASNRLIVAVIDDAKHQYPNGENHPVVMANLLWDIFRPLSLP